MIQSGRTEGMRELGRKEKIERKKENGKRAEGKDRDQHES